MSARGALSAQIEMDPPLCADWQVLTFGDTASGRVSLLLIIPLSYRSRATIAIPASAAPNASIKLVLGMRNSSLAWRANGEKGSATIWLGPNGHESGFFTGELVGEAGSGSVTVNGAWQCGPILG